MEWSNSDCIKLIEQYRQQTVLWDRDDRNHKDKRSRFQSWTEIANHFGCTKAEVERKMNVLLTQYRREKQKMIVEQRRASKWYAFKDFIFLDHIINSPRSVYKRMKRASENNVADHFMYNYSTLPQFEQELQINDCKMEAKEDQNQTFDDGVLMSPNENPEPDETNELTSEQSYTDSSFGTRNLQISSSRTLSKHKELRSKDDCDYVGKNVSIKLRSMDKSQRIIAEKIISEVLFYGQINELDTSAKVLPKGHKIIKEEI
ncbi:hypothetical protein ACFFRR_006267 [Megaselia abdita]